MFDSLTSQTYSRLEKQKIIILVWNDFHHKVME